MTIHCVQRIGNYSNDLNMKISLPRYFSIPFFAGIILFLSYSSVFAQATHFDEGVLVTRVSFPGSVFNEYFSKLVAGESNGNSSGQNQEDQMAQAKHFQSLFDKLSEEDKARTGTMMMGAMMTPYYAKIYFSREKALAKAVAMNYRMESFMNMEEKKGLMAAFSKNDGKNFAISFTADQIKKVWQKEEVTPENYTIVQSLTKEPVIGFQCIKTIYTYKKGKKAANILSSDPPYKIVVWSSPQFDTSLNFFHPLYLDIPHGILKIEVQYDAQSKIKMLYEVVSVTAKHLAESDFIMSPTESVVDWDKDPMAASTGMLSILFSGSEE